MARARNIKPGFYLNEELAGCSLLARFIFPGLWMLADRSGRLEDRPLRIKAAILPYDSADVNELLDELSNAGLIIRYESGNARYIEVKNFTKHQTPHMKEAKSTIPAPDEHGANTVLAPPESPYPESPYPDCLNKTLGADAPSQQGCPDQFDEAWALYPQRPGRSKADAHRAWKARVKEGVFPALMIDGVRRYAEYCRRANTDPQYIKQPSTFFGPGQHYLADWTIPVARASPQFDARSADRKRAVAELTGVPITELGGKQHERIEREINPAPRLACGA